MASNERIIQGENVTNRYSIVLLILRIQSFYRHTYTSIDYIAIIIIATTARLWVQILFYLTIVNDNGHVHIFFLLRLLSSYYGCQKERGHGRFWCICVPWTCMCSRALGRFVVRVLIYIFFKCACDLHYNPFTNELFFSSSLL
jgi:hypothetical protein